MFVDVVRNVKSILVLTCQVNFGQISDHVRRFEVKITERETDLIIIQDKIVVRRK